MTHEEQHPSGANRRRVFQTATRAVDDHAQEKPDLEEQPERAPLGIEDPPPAIRKLVAEMVFFTFLLPHLAQTTFSTPAEPVTSSSKKVLHS